MSNHAGSYMLNRVLQILDKELIFGQISGGGNAQDIVLEILDLSFDYDCNLGEILEGIGERLGVCNFCRRRKGEFTGEICRDCHDTWHRS